MNNKIAIKNFRAFNNDGAEIEVRPITVLTGCNSSGKSSFVKALILLNEIFRKNDRNKVLKDSKLDFTSGTLSMLGDFTTVHNEEAAAQGHDIEIDYNVNSSVFLGNYNVSMSFGATQNDRLNNGQLKSVLIKDADSNVIFGHRNSFSEIGISSVKSKFFAFHSVVYLLNVLNSKHAECNILGTITDEEFNTFVENEFIPTLKEIGGVVGKDVLFDAIEYYSENITSIKDNSKWMSTHMSCFDESMEHNILTYMPELSVINGFPKETFAENFMTLCDKVHSEYITEDDKKLLIDLFVKSESESFLDFYRRLEDEYIDNLFNPVDPQFSISVQELWQEFSSLFSRMDMYVHIPHFFDNVQLVTVFGDESSATPDSLKKETSIFEVIYFILVKLNLADTIDSKYINVLDDEWDDVRYQHFVFDKFKEYIKDGLIDLLSCNVCENIRYVGSSRINIKRLYSLDDSDDFTRTLSEYFEALRLYRPHADVSYEPDTFMNHWLQRFGVGYKIEIKPIGPGLGTMPVIYKDENDKKGRALADYGYGISQLISVLIEIETSILKGRVKCVRKVVNRETAHVNIGQIFTYGGSYKYEDRTIAIEEPEIHLHPKYQSLLAEMFVEAYKVYGINFIIETHSEYLVRRLQTLVAKKEIDKELVSLVYVESRADSEKKVRRIEINEDGCLKEPFGEGFFDEADNLAMNLLLIKGGLA